MAYVNNAELRTRVPLGGEGLSEAQITEARESAIEYVIARTGDLSGTYALARSAAAKLALADLLDIVYPRDARYQHAERDSPSAILRDSAERDLKMFEKAHPEVIDFPDMPKAYITDATGLF